MINNKAHLVRYKLALLMKMRPIAEVRGHVCAFDSVSLIVGLYTAVHAYNLRRCRRRRRASGLQFSAAVSFAHVHKDRYIRFGQPIRHEPRAK